MSVLLAIEAVDPSDARDPRRTDATGQPWKTAKAQSAWQYRCGRRRVQVPVAVTIESSEPSAAPLNTRVRT